MIRLILSLFALSLCLAVSITTANRLDDLHPAGGMAALTGLERDSYRFLLVGAVVPGNRPARCQARLLDAEGAVLDEATLQVPARSSAQIDFAERSSVSKAVDAEVSCDQTFRAYAAAAGQNEPKAIWGKGSGPGAPCKFTVEAQAMPQEPRVLTAVRAGDIHTPTPGDRIGVVCVNIPGDLVLDKLILEWDVTPGLWNPQYAPGSHNLVWLHRGSYVRNTVGNVNVFGQGANFFAMNQNVDNPKPTTGRLRPANLVMGGSTTYRMTYAYDAGSRKAHFGVNYGGKLERTEFVATARDLSLLIPKKNRWSDSSLFVEFGHFGEHNPGKGRPAVPTYGWRYSNMRLTMVQK